MVKNLDAQNIEEAMNEDLPLVVDFWAPWCGPCQMMGPVFEDLSSDFDGKAVFAKVNVDENQALAAKFGVQGIPTIIALKKGKETGRFSGFAQKDVLKQKIESIL